MGCSGRCVRSKLVLWKWWKWYQNDLRRDDNLSIITVIWPSSLGWPPDSCNISWSQLRVERKGDKVVWRIFPCMFLDCFLFFWCFVLSKCVWLFQIRYQVHPSSLFEAPCWAIVLQTNKTQTDLILFHPRIDRNLWELGWWARGCVLRSSQPPFLGGAKPWGLGAGDDDYSI